MLQCEGHEAAKKPKELARALLLLRFLRFALACAVATLNSNQFELAGAYSFASDKPDDILAGRTACRDASGKQTAAQLVHASMLGRIAR